MTREKTSHLSKILLWSVCIVLCAMILPAQARSDMDFPKEMLADTPSAQKYASHTNWRGHRNHRNHYGWWGVGYGKGWRGGYYWRTVSSRCKRATCFTKKCLYQRSASSPLRCETRYWRRW